MITLCLIHTGCYFVLSVLQWLDRYFYGNLGDRNEKMPRGRKKGERMLKEHTHTVWNRMQQQTFIINKGKSCYWRRKLVSIKCWALPICSFTWISFVMLLHAFLCVHISYIHPAREVYVFCFSEMIQDNMDTVTDTHTHFCSTNCPTNNLTSTDRLSSMQAPFVLYRRTLLMEVQVQISKGLSEQKNIGCSPGDK